MNSRLSVPEVSLITSWDAPIGRDSAMADKLPAMYRALQEGIALLDLYFLDHKDIPCYARIADCTNTNPGVGTQRPHEFVARLSPEELLTVTRWLRKELAESYGGRGVGRRPRFAALATYFPNASLPQGTEDPNDELRRTAVAALRNTIYLAYLLGCHCVEIVCGAGVPGPSYEGKETADAYRALRCKAFATSLREVYDIQDTINPLSLIHNQDAIPMVAVELEPGLSFLMNSLGEFVNLRNEIESLAGRDSLPARRVNLNVDVAHFFLIGHTPTDLHRFGLDNYVAHMHISDHGGHYQKGGAHASDLCPGVFHRFEDYRPWLEYAVRQTRESSVFSGVIAIEMEACNNPNEMLAAVNTTRRWLRQVAGEPESTQIMSDDASPDMKHGALLVVDIGHSTGVLLEGQTGLHGCIRLREKVENLCEEVHSQGGSIMSFTGDGFIALFEEEYFALPESAVANAIVVAESAVKFLTEESALSTEESALSGRAALHWGQAYIPASGKLRDQIIGGDVVYTTRLCEWLGRVIEPAMADGEPRALIAATDAFFERLDSQEAIHWKRWRKVNFTGLIKEVTIYLRAE